MNGLAEMGLLSPELENVRTVVRSRYEADVRVIEEINGRAVRLMYELQIHRSSVQELVTASLYIRTLQYVQSSILLIERGLDPPARVMLRASLEALFHLGATAKDSSFLRDYVNADREEMVRFAEKLGKLENPLIREQVANVLTPEWTAAAKRARDEVQAKTPTAKQAAKAAGLEGLYNSAYAFFSHSVHSTIRDVEEQHLKSDEQGIVQALKAEPSTEALNVLFMAAAEILLEAVQVTAGVFKIPIEQFCVAAQSRVKETYGEVDA